MTKKEFIKAARLCELNFKYNGRRFYLDNLDNSYYMCEIRDNNPVNEMENKSFDYIWNNYYVDNVPFKLFAREIKNVTYG